MNRKEGYLLNTLYLSKLPLIIMSDWLNLIKFIECTKEIISLYLLISYATNDTLDFNEYNQIFRITKM